jgi:ribosomally synthesized peptide (two-chain TOMM family)
MSDNADVIVAEWNNWTQTWFKALRKAWQSESFKKELLANPAKTLKDQFGYDLPPSLKLRVVEKESIQNLSPISPKSFDRNSSASPIELTVPIPPTPPNVEEGLVKLSGQLLAQPTVECVCACG